MMKYDKYYFFGFSWAPHSPSPFPFHIKFPKFSPNTPITIKKGWFNFSRENFFKIKWLVPKHRVNILCKGIWRNKYWHILHKKEEKSCIQETNNLLTNMDSRTNTKKILLHKENSPTVKHIFFFFFFFFCVDFKTFISLSFQLWDHLFWLVFPKDFESLKIIEHLTLGSGGKIC